MMDKVFSLFTTIALIALVTTLVLPGRQTASVIGAWFTGLMGWTKAALGG